MQADTKTKRRDGSKTRKALERTALALFVEKGIHATTIRDIAKKANIAEGSLYRHYPSKDALARDLYENGAAAINADILQIDTESQDLESFLSSFVVYLCRLFDADETLFSYILLSQPSTITWLNVGKIHPQETLHKLLAKYLAQREYGDRSITLIAAQILGSILQPAANCFYGRQEKPLADAADEMVMAAFRILKS